MRTASDASLSGKDPSEQRLGSKGLMARLGDALTKQQGTDADGSSRSVASSVKGEFLWLMRVASAL